MRGTRIKRLRAAARAAGVPLAALLRIHKLGPAALLPPAPPRPRRRSWAEISAAAIERGRAEAAERRRRAAQRESDDAEVRRTAAAFLASAKRSAAAKKAAETRRRNREAANPSPPRPLAPSPSGTPHA